MPIIERDNKYGEQGINERTTRSFFITMNPHSCFKAVGALSLLLALFVFLEFLGDQLSRVDPIRDISTRATPLAADSSKSVNLSPLDAARQALFKSVSSLFGSKQYSIELHNRTGISLSIKSNQEGVAEEFTLANGGSHTFISSHPGIFVSYSYQAVRNPGPSWQGSVSSSTDAHADAGITIPHDYFTLTINNHSGHTVDAAISVDRVTKTYTLQDGTTYDMGAYPRQDKRVRIACHLDDGTKLTTSIIPTLANGTWSYGMVIPKRGS